MIRYQLVCGNGHDFEGWFASSAAFDGQQTAGQLACPHCDSRHVEKALMAPAVPSRKRKSAPVPDPVPSGEGEGGSRAMLKPDPKAKELREALRQLRDHVADNADYVGPCFAEEARKIHYKETENRGIWGEASAEEAKALNEEGIEIFPLPTMPEDKN
jgi:hypothetical protein